MELTLIAHPIQIEVLVTHDCILVEHFVKAAQLEADQFVVMQSLKVPILLCHWWQLLQLVGWDVES